MIRKLFALFGLGWVILGTLATAGCWDSVHINNQNGMLLFVLFVLFIFPGGLLFCVGAKK